MSDIQKELILSENKKLKEMLVLYEGELRKAKEMLMASAIAFGGRQTIPNEHAEGAHAYALAIPREAIVDAAAYKLSFAMEDTISEMTQAVFLVATKV